MPQIMAANWKMFKTRAESVAMIEALGTAVDAVPQGRSILIFVPFPSIADAVAAIPASLPLEIGAQNFYPAAEGAFTGEVSPAMLRDVGATWVLTGHSERRHILGESNEFVEQKTAYALNDGFKVVLCVGERLEERESGGLADVLRAQLDCLTRLPQVADSTTFAVAYEPVWAIGTGKVAGPEEIVEAHALVRALLVEKMGDKGKDVAILYGGSVKPDNTGAIMGLDNVDGVLVGGASLQAESFSKIVMAS